MNTLELLCDIGPDSDLLLMSDQHLENARIDLTTQIDLLLTELRAIIEAKRYKARMQQTNLVAIRTIERDHDGMVKDVSLDLMPLGQAIKKLEGKLSGDGEAGVLDRADAETQIYVWKQDGYDVDTARDKS